MTISPGPKGTPQRWHIRAAGPSGSARLRRALRRVLRLARPPAASPAPDTPEPSTAWEQNTEQRLAALEHNHSLSNLRLLLLAIATALADIALEIVKRSR